ncbi:hypothetical protein PHSY_001033 [Pseudozyma hubeiensis SY62]|uniref:YTH domain-containing protein n=1 Tax=Pseudozyma hubeiensis (strain SY62) TaxID=1305764 RepID=R9NXM0_PSEHS|nr:hypothetical protein PHSY_001033 [Pseudozyma hubeiensis SY62]GAC93468.1 hypothetical protein PHSY_001033 [Pseudozyma hubeiensis SY62]
MSVSPPLQGGSSSDADANGSAAANRWGTVSGGMRSPPPAPSSGAGVRRNHTIHGARHHGKPRLEKHFEQPEDHGSPDRSASQTTSVGGDTWIDARHGSPSFTDDASLDLLASPSTRSGTTDHVSSLTPLQALYSKTSVSRNLSLPSRHSTKVASNLPSSATQGRSSLFNSLSAITGGSDLDDHDWEKLIQSSNALGDEHHQDPHALNSLPLQNDHPWSSTLFSHGQLGAPATLSHPASPIARPDPFLDLHHNNGSTSAAGLFDQAALTDNQALPGSANLVRRHQSLNHHAGRPAAHRLATRSSDLLRRYAADAVDPSASPYSPRTDSALSPARHPTSFSATNSPVMPSSYSKAPWNQPAQAPIGSPSRFAASFPSQNFDPAHHRAHSTMDRSSPPIGDLTTHLSNMDITGSAALATQDAQDRHVRSTISDSSALDEGAIDGGPVNGRKLPQLVTNRDALQRGQRTGADAGPTSAAAFVPPIGHAHARHQSSDPTLDAISNPRHGPFTAAPAGGWLDKDNIVGRHDAGFAARGAASDSQRWPQQPHVGPYGASGMDPNVMALSLALAQEQQRNAILQAQLGARSNAHAPQEPHLFGMQPIDLGGPIHSIGQQLRGGAMPSSPPMGAMGQLPSRGQPFSVQQSSPSFRPPMHSQALPPRPPAGGAPAGGTTEGTKPLTPVDPTSLALQKGYNPAPGTFDLAPVNARFFVIKSYTEDDVHKSLKYEIWASTDKGNQRLDKAFRESAQNGPIYLFYSVNASGHFCGMAQMLTPLDYATSSNVWAQDGKWKGTFKVRWIYVKDLPNNQLRHIRLTNTPECKPVTQSRDTQELTPEAGREVLRIMADYSAKTSLLQDFNFYEMQGRAGGPAAGGQQGQQAMPSARPPPSSSPAIGFGGLPPRNSPRPSGSPALGFGGLAFPTSPDPSLAYRAGAAASPNGGARLAQSTHGVSGLGGLAQETSRSGAQPIQDLRSQKKGHDDAVSAAQVAGLAPSAM